MCKAGIGGEDTPQVVFPAVIGRSKHAIEHSLPTDKDYSIGKQALSNRFTLMLRYPIEYGIINHWDDMEKIWHHTFYKELRVLPEEHAVLLTEAPLNPKANRERMTQIMFDKFRVKHLYISIQASLALFAADVVTGTVVDSGDGITHVVPVLYGYVVPHAISRIEVAGRDITDFVMRVLSEEGYSFTTTAEREIARDIKETLGYIAYDYEKEMTKPVSNVSIDYRLPDGHKIAVSNARFRCPEVLFNPELCKSGPLPIHQALYQSIKKCEADVQKEMFASIILSGGSTLFEGFVQRLKKELRNLVSPDIDVNIIDSPKRQYQVWVGGSVFASMPNFIEMSITSDDYYTKGPSVVHEKCF